MLKLDYKSLYRDMYLLKYLSPWLMGAKPYDDAGRMLFYGGNPKYIVNVDVFTMRNQVLVVAEDIVITAGESHSAPEKEIQEMLNEKENEIIDLINKAGGGKKQQYCLDLKSMKIIERDDFKYLLPMRGSQTIFIYENLHTIHYYCMTCGLKIPAESLRWWLNCYIYSRSFALAAAKPDNYGIAFFQGLSSIYANNGQIKFAGIDNSAEIMNLPMPDSGILTFTVPGKLDRLAVLVNKAQEQAKYQHQKGKKK